MRLFNRKPIKEFDWTEAIREMPMPPVEQTKLITAENIEGLKPFADAALLLNLSFIIYNKNIGTEESHINVYCFELGGKL